MSKDAPAKDAPVKDAAAKEAVAKSAPAKSAPAKAAAAKRAGSTDPAQLTKPEKRALAKAAAAKRARAQRRKRIGMYGLTIVVVLGVAVGVYYALNSGKKSNTSAGASASASANAFPSLPAGADPALKTKPDVKAGTGDLTKLNVTTLVTGKGVELQAGQNVTVNYVGVTYKDGKEFDSSWKRSEAFTFQVGTGNVIQGWDQGLIGVKVGSRVQIDIPSNLAYGDNGNPPGALRFVVDVLAAQ